MSFWDNCIKFMTYLWFKILMMEMVFCLCKQSPSTDSPFHFFVIFNVTKRDAKNF